MRQTRVATGGQASEHRARATWVDMLLCARWKVTHLFSLLRTFFVYWDEHKRAERILESQEGKAGGFIAYTAHIQRRTSNLGDDNKTADNKGNVNIIYIEEIGSSLAIRGRGMSIGIRLMARMLQHTEHRTNKHLFETNRQNVG